MRVCKLSKLSNGKICQLLQHDVPVKFDSRPGRSLVACPLEGHLTTPWWVQATEIVWILEI